VDKAAYQGARTRDVSALSTRLGLRSAGAALGLVMDHNPRSLSLRNRCNVRPRFC